MVLRDKNSQTVSGPDGSSTKGDLLGAVGQPGLVLGRKIADGLLLFILNFLVSAPAEAGFFCFRAVFCAAGRGFFVIECRIDRAFVTRQEL